MTVTVGTSRFGNNPQLGTGFPAAHLETLPFPHEARANAQTGTEPEGRKPASRRLLTSGHVRKQVFGSVVSRYDPSRPSHQVRWPDAA